MPLPWILAPRKPQPLMKVANGLARQTSPYPQLVTGSFAEISPKENGVVRRSNAKKDCAASGLDRPIRAFVAHLQNSDFHARLPWIRSEPLPAKIVWNVITPNAPDIAFSAVVGTLSPCMAPAKRAPNAEWEKFVLADRAKKVKRREKANPAQKRPARQG